MTLRLLVCLTLLLAVGVAAWADDTAVQGVGGAVQPMKEHPSIVMQQMDVHVGVTPDHAAVHCVFVFRNTGPATTVKMGFPESGHPTYDPKSPPGFTTFRTWLDGKEVRTRTEGLDVSPADSWRRWRTKQVIFTAKQTRRVEVDYSAPLGYVSDGSGFFEYQVSTGGSWKGPIEHASIRLHLAPDRQGGKYWVPPRFLPAGDDDYLWTAQNLQPTADDNVFIGYQPPRLRLIAGDGLEEETLPLDPFFTKRPIHAPIETLSRLMGAERTGDRWSETLTLGDCDITLRPGSQWADMNGRRQPLMMRIRREHGSVVVPLVQVVSALGGGADTADIETDWEHHTFGFSLPIHKALKDSLGQDAARGALRTLQASALGWAPLPTAQYDEDSLRFAQRHRVPAPWYCAGDFNGDGATDIALFLRKRLDFGIALLESQPRRQFRFLWLEKWPSAEREPKDGFSTILRTISPGEIAYWPEDGSGEKSGRLELTRDGVEVIHGMAAVMYYWDGGRQKYARVITAD